MVRNQDHKCATIQCMNHFYCGLVFMSKCDFAFACHSLTRDHHEAPAPDRMETNQISHTGTGLACIIILFQTVFLLLLAPLAISSDCRTFSFACLYLDHQTFPVPKPCAAIYPNALFAHEEVLISMRIRLFLNMLVFLSHTPYLCGSWTMFSFLDTETLLL